MTLLRSAALLALASLALGASAQNLVTNGDFESADSGSYRLGQSIESGPWFVMQPLTGSFGALVVNDSDDYVISGAKSVLMLGAALSQYVVTVPGQAYAISFDAYGYQGFNSDIDGGSIEVGFESASYTVTAPRGDFEGARAGATASRFTVFATATTSSSLLSFTVPQPNGAEIDNVSVQAVPEPASMAALGLGAVAMLRRRKRA